MTSRQITRALAIADQYRLGAVRERGQALGGLRENRGPCGQAGARQAGAHGPGVGSGRLSDAHMEALGQRADDKVAAAREQRRSSAMWPGGLCPRQQDRIRRDCRQPLESLPRGMLTEASVRQAGCRRGLDPENVKQVLASLGRASELLARRPGIRKVCRRCMAPCRPAGSARNAQGRHRAGGDRRRQGSRTQPDDAAVLRDLEALKGLVERKMDGVVAMAMTNPCHGAPCWKAICNGPASARASWRPCPRRNLTRPLARRLRKFRRSNRRSPQGALAGLSKNGRRARKWH